MKDFFRIFTRRYSAISTKDDYQHRQGNIVKDLYSNYQQEQGREQQKRPKPNQKAHKSLDPNRTLFQGFSILDTFFNQRKTGQRTRIPKCTFIVLSLGILALTTATLVKTFKPYDLIYKWKLTFSKDGEIFNLWEKPPVDIMIKIYLFNITNAEAFLAGKEKLKFEEVGPYVYKEVMSHDDVVFNENGTITTQPKHPLIWQEELSGGRREDDHVVMFNIALLSIAQVAADKNYFFRLPINLLIRQTRSQPIVKMTAREFMFGYKTSLSTIGNTFLPHWISFGDEVGLIDRMYDFDSDYETFYTGKTDYRISGLYDTYRGSRYLPQWHGEHCSDIHLASDGAKFKSDLQENDTVLFFRKSMCRAQKLIRHGEKITIQELDAYKYIFEENALDNGYYNEKNKCFCLNNYCQPRGLVDVTECYYGFPISLSYPHFMEADPEILKGIDGLSPDPNLHSSYFFIQPKSGLPLNCSMKFQINLHMKDVKSMAHVERFSHITLPMVWFEIALQKLPENLKNRFILYLNVLPYVETLGFWIGLFGGIFCLIFVTTRTTLNIFRVTMDTRTHIPDDPMFEKFNRYNDVVRNSKVYRQCEFKLINENQGNDNMKGYDDCGVYEVEEEEAIIIRSSKESNSTKIDRRSSLNIIEPTDANHSSKNCFDHGQLALDRFDESWIGEASSLIEDIGNEEFSKINGLEAFVAASNATNNENVET